MTPLAEDYKSKVSNIVVSMALLAENYSPFAALVRQYCLQLRIAKPRQNILFPMVSNLVLLVELGILSLLCLSRY